MKVKCPENSGWAGGNFVTERSVIIWTKQGEAYLYILPKRADVMSLSLTTTQTARLKQFMKEEEANHPPIPAFAKESEFEVPVAKYTRVSTENQMFGSHVFCLFEDMLFSGSPEGKLTAWRVQKSKETFQDSIISPWAGNSFTIS